MEEKFIKEVLKQAERAYKKNEVPVGAIIVKDNKIIAKAYNLVEKRKNAVAHAEILAIKKASKKLKNWRLNECEMYVTLEPCPMCRHAIELSRIKKVYYLTKKDKEIDDKCDYIYINNINSKDMLKQFFKNKRK